MAALLNTKQTIKKLKNQKNIADIAYSNAREGTDFSEKSGVDEEWFERYMESGGLVSSEEMQLVWGKILANEFEKPGSVPRNMTRILSEFSKTYAEAFRVICSMRALLVQIDEDDRIVSAVWRNIIPFSGNTDYMLNLNLSFELLNELDTLGVIKFDTVAGFAATHITTKKVLVCVCGKIIEIDDHKEDQVPIGNVIFTRAGEALQRITDLNEIEEGDYSEVLKKYYTTLHVGIVRDSHYVVDVAGDIIRLSKTDSLMRC